MPIKHSTIWPMKYSEGSPEHSGPLSTTLGRDIAQSIMRLDEITNTTTSW
jgi:hypothetical protein